MNTPATRLTPKTKSSLKRALNEVCTRVIATTASAASAAHARAALAIWEDEAEETALAATFEYEIAVPRKHEDTTLEDQISSAMRYGLAKRLREATKGNVQCSALGMLSTPTVVDACNEGASALILTLRNEHRLEEALRQIETALRGKTNTHASRARVTIARAIKLAQTEPATWHALNTAPAWTMIATLAEGGPIASGGHNQAGHIARRACELAGIVPGRATQRRLAMAKDSLGRWRSKTAVPPLAQVWACACAGVPIKGHLMWGAALSERIDRAATPSPKRIEARRYGHQVAARAGMIEGELRAHLRNKALAELAAVDGIDARKAEHMLDECNEAWKRCKELRAMAKEKQIEVNDSRYGLQWKIPYNDASTVIAGTGRMARHLRSSAGLCPLDITAFAALAGRELGKNCAVLVEFAGPIRASVPRMMTTQANTEITAAKTRFEHVLKASGQAQ